MREIYLLLPRQANGGFGPFARIRAKAEAKR
jgi:hypothetical protein